MVKSDHGKNHKSIKKQLFNHTRIQFHITLQSSYPKCLNDQYSELLYSQTNETIWQYSQLSLSFLIVSKRVLYVRSIQAYSLPTCSSVCPSIFCPTVQCSYQLYRVFKKYAVVSTHVCSVLAHLSMLCPSLYNGVFMNYLVSKSKRGGGSKCKLLSIVSKK